ncbi:class I SAM-dependent methyltransferase [Nocardioides sp. T2.26MG-1]|uniref:class I SAM-dependent methyltransferase n=1 Tax=Nocardioides sp. T2.26MG-1 TaxID=3041166 RepID=UPI002477B4D2|nr:class I SAM-dependent methyltransferase [Nocardioides sp. T2.26MG-1]CAI9419656.1 hypothetical protein HIDPHFAB_03802 [Nocardioides sp. T2.26MG-1]
MKRIYIAALRSVRSLLRATGLLRLLDAAARRSRTALWVRSWLAIYDLDDMLALDVPWWTLASADAVEDFLRTRPAARVLEWGSGASTVWLARRAGAVVTVEHDPAWAARTARALAARDLDSVELRVVEPRPGPGGVRSAKRGFEGLDFTAYADAIDDLDGDFDLVVIDGRAREACLVRAVDRIADGGLVVFDNVDRARYRAAVEALGTRLRVRWTRGRTPALPYPTRTALISLGRP